MKEIMEIVAKTLAKVADVPIRGCSVFICRNCMTFSYKGKRYVLTINDADEYTTTHCTYNNPPLKGNTYVRAN